MDHVRHQIEVMLVAPFALTYALGRSRGRVVNMGSISGRVSLPSLSP